MLKQTILAQAKEHQLKRKSLMSIPEKNTLQVLQRNYRTSRQRATPAGNAAKQVEQMLKSGKAVGRKGG